MIQETKYIKAIHNQEHEVHPLIIERWSPRAFDEEMIPDHELLQMFEAAKWAPSSMNEQPWRFIFARRGEKAFEKMVSLLMPGNAIWAKKAPVLIMTIIKKQFDANGSPNHSALHDLGLAVGNLSLQAHSLNIGIHQMGGIYHDQAQKVFAIPETFGVVTILAAGYYGDPDQLDLQLKARELAPRTRKNLNTIVYHENFQKEE
jgi:nitroreductase